MYRRLFSIVFLVNLAVLIWLTINTTSSTPKNHRLTLSTTSTAAAFNILLAILIRQEHVVNALFILMTSTPETWPLWIRRRAAKGYTYGGIHSSYGTAAVFWYIASTVLISISIVHSTYASRLLAVEITAHINTFLFLLVLVFAHPAARMKWHNHFEWMQRFGGWMALGIFWVQTFLVAITDRDMGALQGSPTLGNRIIRLPAFWCLVTVTCCLFYAWIRLRRHPVRAEYLSAHAVRLHFDHTTLDYCMGVRLSTQPLLESHAFATIPNPNKSLSFSVLVSNAGDWTKNTIQRQPTTIWTKGAPTYGVLRVADLFRRCIAVTTGSGIGPCLSLLSGRPDVCGRVRVL